MKKLTKAHSTELPPIRGKLGSSAIAGKQEEKKQGRGALTKKNAKDSDSSIIKTRNNNTNTAATYSPSMVHVIQNLTKFVPALVIEKLISRAKNKSAQLQLPELQSMETVVIFADISGFTNLSESCIKKGRGGNEDLAFCINRYMEDMVCCLGQYGGDIIKFVGDAMIVMWPPIDREKEDWWKDRLDCIRKALQCCQEIQKRLNNQQVLPGVTLSVKIGVAYGKCAILYVGGVFDRNETLTVGEALQHALKSEGMAKSGGEVWVSETCFKHVQESGNLYRGTMKEDLDGLKYYKLDLQFRGQRVKVKADMMKILSQFSVRDLQEAQQLLEMNVVRCAIPFIKINQQPYASEIRSLTIMFVNLGIDLSSADTAEGIEKIQEVMVAVQEQVYRLEGSLNKLVMDDKGSTLICIFGLPPYAHDDDASRAIFTGFNMIKALQKIDRKMYCNIGIASGECFSGIVGGSGSRKEFSVMGDIVNLAARIMGSLKGSKNQITCDSNTRMLAAANFTFSYNGHRELKGKMISSPFFKPTPPDTHTDQYLSKIMPYEFFLWPHQNPLLLTRDCETTKPPSWTVGFESLLSEMSDQVQKYFIDPTIMEPFVAIIQGEIGSGKTAFIRNHFQDLKQSEQFAEYMQYNKNQLPIFANSLDAESRLHYLNAWRPIFVMLVKFVCKRKQIDRHHFIADFIKKEKVFEMADLIIEITGVERAQMRTKQKEMFKVPQVQVRQLKDASGKSIAFTRTPKYDDDVQIKIVKFFTNLFKYCVGDSAEVESDWGGTQDDGTGKSGQKSQKRIGSQQKHSNFLESESDSENHLIDPIIICIDNAHLMDSASWKLFGDLINEDSHVAFYLIIKYDYRDRLLIVPEAKDAFDEAWNNITDGRINSENIRLAELPSLSEEHIRALILKSAAQYRITHQAEVESMTEMIEPSEFKNHKDSADWKIRLTKQWQLKKIYTDIDPVIISVIQKNCRGNPYLCLDYFKQMLHTGLIEINDTGFIEPKEQFQTCHHYDDWSPVVTPQLSKRICAEILSNFLHAKKSNRPGQEEQSAICIVLLQVASVLGREFSVDALKHISPLPKDSQHSKRVDDAISSLEKADLLEIIDQGHGQFTRCRFVQVLMCETLYQMVRYKAIKRNLHTKVEEYIQQYPTKMVKQPAITRADQLLWHMLLASDQQTEECLTLERRNALTVMRIQKLVEQKPPVNSILTAALYMSQSTGVHKINSIEAKPGNQRLLMLTRDSIRWYHDVNSAMADNYLGSAKLSFIYETMKVPATQGKQNQAPLYAFLLEVSMHKTQKSKYAGRQTIILASESVLLRDQWLAAIDYLKLRANYDAYRKNNQLVHFLMGQNADHDDQKEDEEDQRDMSDLLYDFGGKLKQNTVQSTFNGGQKKLTSNMSQGGLLRRGTAMGTEIGVKEVKAADLVGKLALLYKVGITSFVHQLTISSMRDSYQVFTSDEEVERLPMQYPPDQVWAMKKEIAFAENQIFDENCESKSRVSNWSSSHHASVNNSKQNKFEAMQKRKTFNDKSQGISVPIGLTSKSGTPKNAEELKRQLASFAETEDSGLSSSLNSANQIMHNDKARHSSYSEGLQLTSLPFQMNNIAEDPEMEVSSSNGSNHSARSLSQNMAGLQVEVSPSKQIQGHRKSDSNAAERLQQQQQATADSGGRISEQLADIGLRTATGDRSDLSRNATQVQYEASDADAAAVQGGNRRRNRQISADGEKKQLKELIIQQQKKIEQMILQQRDLMQQVELHENILSPNKSLADSSDQQTKQKKFIQDVGGNTTSFSATDPRYALKQQQMDVPEQMSPQRPGQLTSKFKQQASVAGSELGGAAGAQQTPEFLTRNSSTAMNASSSIITFGKPGSVVEAQQQAQNLSEIIPNVQINLPTKSRRDKANEKTRKIDYSYDMSPSQNSDALLLKNDQLRCSSQKKPPQLIEEEASHDDSKSNTLINFCENVQKDQSSQQLLSNRNNSCSKSQNGPHDKFKR